MLVTTGCFHVELKGFNSYQTKVCNGWNNGKFNLPHLEFKVSFYGQGHKVIGFEEYILIYK